MNDSQVKKYCIDLLQILKQCLQTEVEPRKIIPAVDEAIKHLEEEMKVPSTFNQKGTWRLSNEQLTIKVEVGSDNNIQSVASVAHSFIGQPLSNLVRWMNHISKTDIFRIK